MSYPRPAYPLLSGIPRAVLSGLGVVVQSDTDSAAVVAVVLADDLLAVQLPKTRVVVAAGCDKIRAIGTERTVPDPPLVACEGRLQREGLRLLTRPNRLHLLDLPDLGRVISAARCQLLHVRRE